MVNDLEGAPPTGPAPADLPEYAQRCRDLRLHDDMWIPRYVWRYAPQLGTNGLALYVCLAFHCTAEAPERWPSHNQLAELLGVSRSTIERTLRLLRTVQMLRTTPCISPHGQRSNYWDLIDPPGETRKSRSHGAKSAGAVTSDGGAPSPVVGAPVTSDGGAPSPVTAPSLQNGSERGGEGASLSPSAALPFPKPALAQEIEWLSAHWLAQLAVIAAGPRGQHAAEIAAEVTELLRRGWTADQLRETMDSPDRDRMEWPRQWRARCHPGKPKVARTPPTALEMALKRNVEAEQAARDQASPAFQEEMRRLARRIGKPVDAPPAEAES